jgi:hypothetical protein
VFCILVLLFLYDVRVNGDTEGCNIDWERTSALFLRLSVVCGHRRGWWLSSSASRRADGTLMKQLAVEFGAVLHHA